MLHSGRQQRAVTGTLAGSCDTTRSILTASSIDDSCCEGWTKNTTVENTFLSLISGDTSPVEGLTQWNGAKDSIKAQYVVRVVASLCPNAWGTSDLTTLNHCTNTSSSIKYAGKPSVKKYKASVCLHRTSNSHC